MKSDSEIDNVQALFSRLKSDGFIDANRKIKHRRPKSKKLNFWTLRIPIKRIYYYGDPSSSPEDEIMFGLLHEESHLRYPQNMNRLAMAWFILIASATVYLLWPAINGSRFTAVSILCVLLAASAPFILIPVFRKELMKDETEADYHASIQLKKKYGIQKPSLVIKRSLEKFDGPLRKDDPAELFMAFLNTHPSLSKRAELIRERVDSK